MQNNLQFAGIITFYHYYYVNRIFGIITLPLLLCKLDFVAVERMQASGGSGSGSIILVVVILVCALCNHVPAQENIFNGSFCVEGGG